MRIVCISDTHDLHRLLTIPEADLLIHAGDLTETGDRDDVRSAMRWLNAQPCRDIVATAGNHDLALKSPSFVRDMRESFPRVQLLIDEGAEISGRKVWVSPWAPMPQTLWAYTAPHGSETLARAWAGIPDDVEVLVTHTPPYGILDWSGIVSDRLGCELLAARLPQLRKLRLHVFGHVHGGRGVEEHGTTTFVNASSMGDDGLAPAIVVEIA
ncbi:MAG: metallophosphatase domain-containing protein [Vulcanimicrobiaceae bacterium]